jgi:hypothetical protein
LTNPSEDFEAIDAGHFEVQQEEVRERVLVPVGKLATAFKVRDRFIATFDGIDGIWNESFFESPANEQNVFLRIIGKED